MDKQVLAFMQQVASDVEQEFGTAVEVTQHAPLFGAIDYEVVMVPRRTGAARISWFTIANTFTIAVSSKLEWQSEEWIEYNGDDQDDVRLGEAWSVDVIWRIINYGALLVRIRSGLPSVLRATQIAIGDEEIQNSYEVLESHGPWR